ncbi:MAG TPA: heme-dependent oxidative N-demethylase subunit alpha family protein [Candidatus Limnocylindria bacterium]|nr:heme-dependent oxidative N-demethylase subunit alpha family protein [Candidatus Limnocylindria bacterium]
MGISVLSQDFRREWTARLFGGARFEFGFGMRRGKDESWFHWDGWDRNALDERRHWIEVRPEWSVVWNSRADRLLDEALTLFPKTDVLGLKQVSGLDRAKALCRAWEPDWLLLSQRDNGEFHLDGAIVCFPSSWDVREKADRSITDVHSIVPTLNENLGARIRSFLSRLPEDGLFERENWGLAATCELNAHPERGLPRLGAVATLDRTWLRLEHQAFRRLPRNQGLLFALRVEVFRLDELLLEDEAKGDFARMMETMPPEVASYKGVEMARSSLIRQCQPANG